jgi:hypothetical protein
VGALDSDSVAASEAPLALGLPKSPNKMPSDTDASDVNFDVSSAGGSGGCHGGAAGWDAEGWASSTQNLPQHRKLPQHWASEYQRAPKKKRPLDIDSDQDSNSQASGNRDRVSMANSSPSPVGPALGLATCARVDGVTAAATSTEFPLRFPWITSAASAQPDPGLETCARRDAREDARLRQVAFRANLDLNARLTVRSGNAKAQRVKRAADSAALLGQCSDPEELLMILTKRRNIAEAKKVKRAADKAALLENAIHLLAWHRLGKHVEQRVDSRCFSCWLIARWECTHAHLRGKDGPCPETCCVVRCTSTRPVLATGGPTWIMDREWGPDAERDRVLRL